MKKFGLRWDNWSHYLDARCGIRDARCSMPVVNKKSVVVIGDMEEINVKGHKLQRFKCVSTCS
jgi:hypothetical protein